MFKKATMATAIAAAALLAMGGGRARAGELEDAFSQAQAQAKKSLTQERHRAAADRSRAAWERGHYREISELYDRSAPASPHDVANGDFLTGKCWRPDGADAGTADVEAVIGPEPRYETRVLAAPEGQLGPKGHDVSNLFNTVTRPVTSRGSLHWITLTPDGVPTHDEFWLRRDDKTVEYGQLYGYILRVSGWNESVTRNLCYLRAERPRQVPLTQRDREAPCAHRGWVYGCGMTGGM